MQTRRVLTAVAVGWLVVIGVPLGAWLSAPLQGSTFRIISLVALFLASIAVGYALRGMTRLATLGVLILIWLATSATGLLLASYAGRSVAGGVVALGTMGALSFHGEYNMRGAQLNLPWIGLLFALCTLIWQGFFEGLFGVSSAHSRGATRP